MSEILERFARLSPAKWNLLLSQVRGGALQLLAKLSPAPMTRMSVEAMNRAAALDASIDISGAAPPSKVQDSLLLTGATPADIFPGKSIDKSQRPGRFR